MGQKDRYLRRLGAKVGSNCHLITKVANFGTEPYLIQIGDQVTVASGVYFINHDGGTRVFRSRYPEMNAYGNLFGPITVGDNCFIGINAILLPGTKIGDNSIVGAGSVVKGEFPNDSVIAGVPARRLSSLQEYVAKVRTNMIPLQATNREDLKNELLTYFSINTETL